MITYDPRTYHDFLSELKEFETEGKNINPKQFDKWLNALINKLNGNYLVRFKKLKFYSLSENLSSTLDSDDLPF